MLRTGMLRRPLANIALRSNTTVRAFSSIKPRQPPVEPYKFPPQQPGPPEPEQFTKKTAPGHLPELGKQRKNELRANLLFVALGVFVVLLVPLPKGNPFEIHRAAVKYWL